MILVYQGKIEDQKLRHEGISVDNLEEAARAHGVANLSDVETAVSEVNGTISIIPKSDVTPRKLTKVSSRRQKS